MAGMGGKRSLANALVFFCGAGALKPGDIVKVLVEDSDERDPFAISE